ncbi:transmembrane protein, putative [Medicago truncatula]|uniref:Transmembrane protein, putative n=1 Tax=Medicago truncatula TaxID=3880 RepID=G7K3M0_MEDTR|nr:transmembrane protein, putative [Medicago truncatula]
MVNFYFRYRVSPFLIDEKRDLIGSFLNFFRSIMFMIMFVKIENICLMNGKRMRLVRQEKSVRSVLMGENTWTHEGLM